MAFQTGRILVPVLGAGLGSAEVIEPLKNLQLLSLEVPEQASQAFGDLGFTLTDPIGFASLARDAGRRSAQAALADAGWSMIDHEAHSFAWDGPLEDLRDGQGVPVPPGLIVALKNAGLTTQFGIDGDLSNEFSKGFAKVWRIDLRFRRKHSLFGAEGQVLLARPTAT